MVQLQKLTKTASAEDIRNAIDLDGACILEDVISHAEVDQLMTELMPFVECTSYGKDAFTGTLTRRTGALTARSPACRPLITHPDILKGANEFLLRFTKKIQLHLTQTIYIEPGQGAQLLHRDRYAWDKHLPASVEPQFNTIWALTDFTADNGATRVVPGSNKWPWQQEAKAEQICQAEMTRGSVLLYSGSVIHSGGENRSDTARMGLNITYCLGWLRQEENQYLSCPPDIARTLPNDLQKLLGYTHGNYALGYYSDPYAEGELGTDIHPPEHAVGSRTKADIDTFNP